MLFLNTPENAIKKCIHTKKQVTQHSISSSEFAQGACIFCAANLRN